ncbi:hypothetical protein CTAYLR_010415 [Chrysophaeum taylorii]|uniref:UDENN domain-containing protein n=1 Tax=Chrysophaeum taylorii TaxID=2483200 RepID=A0AAD7UFN8_9STRA|nr:hypothetical protein CTAYLR_010415 [Chrysophaeum taylorii]
MDHNNNESSESESSIRASGSSQQSPQWSRFIARPGTPRTSATNSGLFAWQSTETTVTRAALVPSGLVDDVLVVGAEAFSVSEEEILQAAAAGKGVTRPSKWSEVATPLQRAAVVLERLAPASKEGRGCLTDGGSLVAAAAEVAERPEPPQRVEWFCFPSGVVDAAWKPRRPATRSHVFALFSEGAPLRGIVLTYYTPAVRSSSSSSEMRLWVPVAICLLTRLAIVPALTAWIEQLAVALDEARASEEAEAREAALDCIFAVATQLADEVPRPVAGVLSLKIAGPAKEMVHAREHYAASRGNQIRRKSVFDEALARPTGGGGCIWLAAMLLGPDGLAAALACALLERPILLVAESTSVLAPVAEALLALVRPFEWSHVYVPVLPRPLLELLDAPQPFLLGILSSWLPDDFEPTDEQPENDRRPLPPPPEPRPARVLSDTTHVRPPGLTDRPSSSRRASTATFSVLSSMRRETPSRRRRESFGRRESLSSQFAPVAPGTVAFNLDTGSYFSPGPSLLGDVALDDAPSLPDDFADAIRAATAALQNAAIDALDDAPPAAARIPRGDALLAAEAGLQAASANQMRRLLQGCASFIDARRDDRALLRADDLVEAHPVPADRPFLRRLAETQHFWQFIDSTRESLIEAKDPDLASISVSSLLALRDENIDADDAYCYTVPPPLQHIHDDETRPTSDAARKAISPPPPGRGVRDEDRATTNDITIHAWHPDPVFGADRQPAATRVYRYGTLADLLGVPFEDLWAQLEGDQDVPPGRTP